MKKQITDEQLIEILEGVSNPDVEAEIAKSAEIKKRFEDLKDFLSLMEGSAELEVPSEVGQHVSNAILQESLSMQNAGLGWSWMHIAAAVAFLVVGFVFGKFSTSDQSVELAMLNEEIRSLREVTLASTLQNHSASERILAVSQIEQKNSINYELIQTLVFTLNGDESTNVRYAALQALRKFISEGEVRAALVKSLESQSDPLIQISLIQILVETEEKSAIAPLKDILNNEELTPEVKRQAEVALKVLT